MGLAIQTGVGMKGQEDVKDKIMVYSNYNRVGHDASNCIQQIVTLTSGVIIYEVRTKTSGYGRAGGNRVSGLVPNVDMVS